MGQSVLWDAAIANIAKLLDRAIDWIDKSAEEKRLNDLASAQRNVTKALQHLDELTARLKKDYPSK